MMVQLDVFYSTLAHTLPHLKFKIYYNPHINDKAHFFIQITFRTIITELSYIPCKNKGNKQIMIWRQLVLCLILNSILCAARYETKVIRKEKHVRRKAGGRTRSQAALPRDKSTAYAYNRAISTKAPAVDTQSLSTKAQSLVDAISTKVPVSAISTKVPVSAISTKGPKAISTKTPTVSTKAPTVSTEAPTTGKGKGKGSKGKGSKGKGKGSKGKGKENGKGKGKKKNKKKNDCYGKGKGKKSYQKRALKKGKKGYSTECSPAPTASPTITVSSSSSSRGVGRNYAVPQDVYDIMIKGKKAKKAKKSKTAKKGKKKSKR